MAAQQPIDDLPEETVESQPKKSIFSSNLLVMLILFVLAMAEMLAAYFFVLPSPATVSASVKETAQKDVPSKVPYKPDVEQSLQQTEEREEVDLGSYTFTEGDLSNLPFRVSIQFFGLVNKTDRQEYDKRYEIHKNRIRNAILVILRSSKQSEIIDPTLGLVKNKVMVKVNEILGMPLVKGVIYTDIAIQTGG